MKLNKEEIPNLTYSELINHIHLSWEFDNKENYKELKEALKDEFASREPTVNYECPKCNYHKYIETQIRTAGGVFSSLFNVQTKKFRVITCDRCNYSELYKSEISPSLQVLDWFIG